MIRELGTMVILLGAMTATELRTNVNTDSYHKIESSPLVSYLSSTEGLGVGVKGSSAGLGSLDMHYSMTAKTNEWGLTVSPFFGLSYAHHFHELPQTVQFSMGIQGLVSYERFVLGLGYWHMSNGDALGLSFTDKQNIGIDLMTIQGGITF